MINEFAQSQGYKVVRDIGGHGVGLEFHEDPFVSYVTRRDTGMLLVPGMVFTIEPMINLGTDEIFIDSDNDWTVYTEDGAPSAQWEVTVAVTEDGYEIKIKPIKQEDADRIITCLQCSRGKKVKCWRDLYA